MTVCVVLKLTKGSGFICPVPKAAPGSNKYVLFDTAGTAVTGCWPHRAQVTAARTEGVCFREQRVVGGKLEGRRWSVFGGLAWAR